MMNKTQRLQRWYDENATADSLLFGEFMHLGANQTILKVGLLGIEPNENSVVLDMACAVGGNGAVVSITVRVRGLRKRYR